ncbi:hypothetical protein EDD21DRAFT_403601 [Dissophora ornata]|nr:hypothetical protein EDD21DRAFT_403601 [Dissophora ornata]
MEESEVRPHNVNMNCLGSEVMDFSLRPSTQAFSHNPASGLWIPWSQMLKKQKGLDLGQVCVVGVSALFSESPLPLGRCKAKKKRQLSNKDVDVDMKDCLVLYVEMEDVSVVDSNVRREVPSIESVHSHHSVSFVQFALCPNPVKFYNLAVKQKAVYQPTFKHCRWMEEQKALVPVDAARPITDIESSMPPLRGEGAS